jgi:hypothetical protein
MSSRKIEADREGGLQMIWIVGTLGLDIVGEEFIKTLMLIAGHVYDPTNPKHNMQAVAQECVEWVANGRPGLTDV